ncbi:MAG: hypothetical protein J0626_06160 [Rhodospirillaceae bacterium]|nr:hypothetical protein [Rhodospirillaceae bacterium]
MASDALAALIADELHVPVGAAAYAMAEFCRRRHGDAVLGVLFYGSCLRQPDQALTESLLDFYIIVDDYAAAYDNRMLAWANALLPPNVFYVEMPRQVCRYVLEPVCCRLPAIGPQCLHLGALLPAGAVDLVAGTRCRRGFGRCPGAGLPDNVRQFAAAGGT